MNVSLSLQSLSTCSSARPYQDCRTIAFVIRATSSWGLTSPVFLKRGSRAGLNASQSTSFATLPSLPPSGNRLVYSDFRTFLTLFIGRGTGGKDRTTHVSSR